MESVTNLTRRKCYYVSYKMRCFYSKGAFLVVFWAFLASLSASFLTYIMWIVFHDELYKAGKSVSIALMVTTLPIIASAPIVGWMADTRYGNYKVFRFGAILFLLATVMACIGLLVEENTSIFGYDPKLFSSTFVYAIAVVGGIACLVTAVQLGLDQMPDASSSNITSFISWSVLATTIGVWVSHIGNILVNCTNLLSRWDNSCIRQLFGLLPVIFMVIMCCSLFVLGPKWLIIEPNCPQSLKTIYQVLKFAWKHKSPLNRSALTYWEEDIPSRLDLGKSRYGGPFTTEQVEDVKTFFNLLIIFLPISLVNFCISYPASIALSSYSLIKECNAENTAYSILYNTTTAVIVVLLGYEFVLYPLLRNKLPSILKRIGIISFLAIIFNIVELTITVILFVDHEKQWWYSLIRSILFNCLIMFLLQTVMEFVCAQSPYKMRALLVGYVMFLFTISLGINAILAFICHKYSCFKGILYSVYTALSLVGFVVYCLLARWYKMRVRDEEYNVHRVVEEVYDRYLSQRNVINVDESNEYTDFGLQYSN